MRLAPLSAGLMQLVLAAGLCPAQTWHVCIDDQAGLNLPAKGSFYREFNYLVIGKSVELATGSCEADSIRLEFHQRGEGQDPDVLGAAYFDGTRITPRLQIYVEPVVDMIPSDWTVVGRALARVAVHEVAHYVDQETHHLRAGLMRERFSGPELAAEDSYPFRWISERR